MLRGPSNPYAEADLVSGGTAWRARGASFADVARILGTTPEILLEPRLSPLYRPRYAAAGMLPPGGPTQLALYLLDQAGVTVGWWCGATGAQRYAAAQRVVETFAAQGIGHTTRQIVEQIDQGACSRACLFKEPTLDFYPVDMGEPFGAGLRPQVSDVYQGLVGNCELCASMASLAWATPDLLVSRFLRFQGGVWSYAMGHPGHRSTNGIARPTPAVTPGDAEYLFYGCHGPGGGVTWPSLLEMQVAQWASSCAADCVDVRPLGGVGLTTIAPGLFVQAPASPDALRSFLRVNCPGGKASFAMVAGTPETIANEGKHLAIVPSHAYSVLGYIERGSELYVVLRNPWGFHGSAGPGTLPGTHTWNGVAVGGGYREGGSGASAGGPTWNPVFALDVRGFAAIFRDGIMGARPSSPAHSA